MSVPVFVDTSAWYAFLDADDARHSRAVEAFRSLRDGLTADELEWVTHGSVIVETTSLLQRRLGLGAARIFLDELVPLCSVTWVGAELHARATSAMLAAGRRGVSLVDWTSFVVMRERSIRTALAFDDDFVDQGFALFA